jgi:hypothetical protein
MNYKHGETEVCADFLDYVAKRSQHYSGNDDIELIDYLQSIGVSEGLCISNVMKYVGRFGKKCGKNPNDILKAMHYLSYLYYFNFIKDNPESIHNFKTDNPTQHAPDASSNDIQSVINQHSANTVNIYDANLQGNMGMAYSNNPSYGGISLMSVDNYNVMEYAKKMSAYANSNNVDNSSIIGYDNLSTAQVPFNYATEIIDNHSTNS